MQIGSLEGVLAKQIKLNELDKNSEPGFNNVFTELVDSVKTSQAESSQLLQEYASGGPVELHEVLIAGAKSKTNFELLMEIRNKGIDMYRELIRMPV
ncbi:MAG: flagellar hook-basal body complex protein FliE [Chlorobiaceae bacterium]|nr:flagellar hook-basal body complex protein FliE [Chlorobiaceae bacterium]MBA4310964.1 flagellar hook-basal body complex protein FliE [Chlorobiaceae bacterium]